MTAHVLVPVAELEKLEESRVSLYKFLEDKLTEDQKGYLHYHTDQIWRVANTKNWRIYLT